MIEDNTDDTETLTDYQPVSDVVDLYPSSGSDDFSDFDDDRTEDEIQQQEAENTERSMMRSAGTKLTDDVLAWFDTQIRDTDSVAAAVEYARTTNHSVDDTLHAFDIVRDLLERKRDELTALKEEYLS
jgi:hypothetical protein